MLVIKRIMLFCGSIVLLKTYARCNKASFDFSVLQNLGISCKENNIDFKLNAALHMSLCTYCILLFTMRWGTFWLWILFPDVNKNVTATADKMDLMKTHIGKSYSCSLEQQISFMQMDSDEKNVTNIFLRLTNITHFEAFLPGKSWSESKVFRQFWARNICKKW